MRLYLTNTSWSSPATRIGQMDIMQCTALARVSKGEGGKRQNPQKLPQSLTAVRWHSKLLESNSNRTCLYAVDFTIHFFFPGPFSPMPSWQLFPPFIYFYPGSCVKLITRVYSPKVKLQLEFCQGQCLLGKWIQCEWIDNHSLNTHPWSGSAWV